MKNTYLDGENEAPRYSVEAKKLIGKRVQFLQKRGIDKSGRGYFFPESGTVNGVFRRNIIIDGSYISLNDLVELRVIEK